jgi:hypothetical protein
MAEDAAKNFCRLFNLFYKDVEAAIVSPRDFHRQELAKLIKLSGDDVEVNKRQFIQMLSSKTKTYLYFNQKKFDELPEIVFFGQILDSMDYPVTFDYDK